MIYTASYPNFNYYIVLALELINWGFFLAVWVSLSDDIGKHKDCVARDGSHDHSTPCNTLYLALAFAIADWLLFSLTFFNVIRSVRRVKEDTQAIEIDTRGENMNATRILLSVSLGMWIGFYTLLVILLSVIGSEWLSGIGW